VGETLADNKKYNHQKSLFICLFDLKPGGKRYEKTCVAKRTAFLIPFVAAV